MSPLFRRCNPPAGGVAGYQVRRDATHNETLLLPGTTARAVPSGAAANAFGAWTTVGTPPASDLYVSHLHQVRPTIPATAGVQRIEWSHGAGNTPVDAVLRGLIVNDPTSDDLGWMDIFDRAWGFLIPSGSQVYARALCGEVGPIEFNVALAGWPGAYPDWATLPDTSVPALGAGRYYPSNTGAPAAITAAVLPAYGAWAQLVAAAPGNGLLVTRITPQTILSGITALLTAYQLGIGAAGSEVAVATVLTGNALASTWVWPPVWVQAGERLAIRAGSNGAGNRSAYVKVYDL